MSILNFLKALPVSYNIRDHGTSGADCFRVKFPFSWLIKELIDEAAQLPQHTVIQKGNGYLSNCLHPTI